MGRPRPLASAGRTPGPAREADHFVTNDRSDRSQLSAMAFVARDAIGKLKLQAHADRGYHSSRELKVCDDAGIAAYVPKSMPSLDFHAFRVP